MNETAPFIEKFERFENEVKQPSWLFPLRKAGIARFAEQGFPTINDEDWRFTNVTPITKLPFKPVFEGGREGVNAKTVETLSFGQLPAYRLVFVNGLYVADLSSAPPANGIVISNLAGALKSHPALVEKHLGRCAKDDDNSFAALNTAFFQDGGFVYLPAGKTLDKPIHLLYVSTAKDSGITSHPRNLIVAEKGSQVTVLETYARTADASYLTNAVTELVAGEGAVVEHCKFQDESPSAFHIAAIHAHLGRSANLISHSFATGARLSRNNIRTSLAGEGVECILNGLYLTKGEQLADHHMVVEHAQPHCNSHEYYNGILDDRSKGVFHGRILVRQIAQKTDAKQTNKNLLLSEDATVDTKPQLEIYADDVKCTHGATVGQLNDESIFYLRTRGIGADTARRMLIHAFAGEIIERIRHRPAREELDKLIWDRLEENPLVGNKTA
jgi:Fe-S cluster assembly protein SufD